LLVILSEEGENMKKLFGILLILCTVSTLFIVPATAIDKSVTADGMIVKPMWTYINTMTHRFDINRLGLATAECLLSAFNGDQLKVTVEIQVYNDKDGSWSTIKSWSNVTDYISCGAGGNYAVIKNRMYRSVATGYVYVNGKVVEQHQMISSVKVYE